MKQNELSESAEDDLLSIFIYTLKKWDLEQAALYENQITNAFECIAGNPFFPGSKARDQYANRCRFFKTGKHIVVYLSNRTPIGIIRVLHESMDFEQHVGEEFFP